MEDELADLRRKHLTPRSLIAADVAGENLELLEAAEERAARRVDRMGPVNPLAEQECAELEERAAFLAEQRRDLEASLTQLQEVVSDLDAAHRDLVRRYLRDGQGELLRSHRHRLPRREGQPQAGGGHARLPGARRTGRRAELEEVLGEEAKPPVRGIGLEVKFANKSPRSLTLLSGGEKAMTAIAFLFSLFLARPCPFYILDEVEASLDDINIRRFLSLVRRYRDKTQFIIITHQRQTMEVADTLYGVTLESDGTSRILSRRLTVAKGA